MIRHLFGLAAALSMSPACAANPPITAIFTADPAVLVDGGRLYLYTGRDEAEVGTERYRMHEWRLYSTCDMRTWVDHGVPANVKTFAWAKSDAYAADVVKRGARYYLYAPVKHGAVKGMAIGVAVADRPTGPFVDARGSALVTNDMTRETPNDWDDIDPAVFVDDDGQAYLYFGNKVLKYAKLKPNMIELDGPIHTVGLFDFEEAPYLHKRNGVYYLSYASGFPESIVYATGPGPTGPWTYRGLIMEKNKVTRTIHQAFADFNGKSYAFYHNDVLPGGGDYRRSVALEEFEYGKDGALPLIRQTSAGPAANPTPTCRN
ncbi:MULTISPECIES: glycoside hydrolase family 43 protein [unclassified Massilia]|uniref:glycoside hydrolase family 43 protein n=1 Tax=unclassified Massilia TaxID=2609279 RepID=UPI001780A808|nr:MULTISPECIES: glycoside hydrolase family 43 protein [unclassified Massilia]MBD8531035.1 family 43 glycosylhydrolase [Massilia sp. CFBP 13647]MBD8674735.1 family 43 glycosylhydrolase [Massilia sp. CFBP 13721]